MKNTNIQSPNWFETKNYNHYKKLNSKELCIAIETRRLQIEYLNGNISIDEHYNGLEEIKPEQRKIFHEKIFKVTREDFYFNSENYNKSIDDKDYYYISNMLALNSNIISGNVFISSPFISVDSLRLSDIQNNFMVSRDVADIYGRYIFNMKNEDFENDNKNLFNEIAKSREGIENYYVDIVKKENNFENPLDDNDFHSLPQYEFYSSKLTADDEMDLVRNLFDSNKVKYDYIAKSSDNKLFLKIDINAPNEVILKEVALLIENKRKTILTENKKLFNIKLKDKKTGGYRIIKTLIEQRIIQYLDLYIWNIENKQNPTSDWYMKVLYKNEKAKGQVIAHSKMNDTIKPNAKKWLNTDWLYSMYYIDIPPYNNINTTE